MEIENKNNSIEQEYQEKNQNERTHAIPTFHTNQKIIGGKNKRTGVENLQKKGEISYAENGTRELTCYVKYKSKKTVRHRRAAKIIRDQANSNISGKKPIIRYLSKEDLIQTSSSNTIFQTNSCVHKAVCTWIKNSPLKRKQIDNYTSDKKLIRAKGRADLEIIHNHNEKGPFKTLGSSCDQVDRDAVSNMKDNIKCFLLEKATGLRNVVNETASVFEGAGESNSNGELSIDRHRTSPCRYAKKVFLKALCDNARNVQNGKSAISFGKFNPPGHCDARGKNENEESYTFESTGQKRNIIFSEIRVSKEKLDSKKRRKKSRKRKENVHHTNDDKSKPPLLDLPDKLNEFRKQGRVDGSTISFQNETPAPSLGNTEVNSFLKCEIFESVGENNEIDWSSMIPGIRNRKNKTKTCLKNKHNVQRLDLIFNKPSKHHSKFTLCKHLCAVKQCYKNINRVTQEGDNYNLDKSENIVLHNYKCEIPNKSPSKAVLEGKIPLEKEVYRKSKNTLNKNYIQDFHESSICKRDSAQVSDSRGDNPSKNIDNENKQGHILQFCIPEKKHLLLFNSEEGSTEGASKSSRNFEINTRKGIPLAMSKSLNSLKNIEPIINHKGSSNKEKHKIKKVFSDSVFSKCSIGISNNANCFSNYGTSSCLYNYEKKLRMCHCINNQALLDLKQEDVYECCEGNSDYLEVNHYIQVRKDNISESSVKLLDQYTLDIRGLGKQKSQESLPLKQKIFNSIYKSPSNKRKFNCNLLKTKETNLASKLKDRASKLITQRRVPEASTTRTSDTKKMDKTKCIEYYVNTTNDPGLSSKTLINRYQEGEIKCNKELLDEPHPPNVKSKMDDKSIIFKNLHDLAVASKSQTGSSKRHSPSVGEIFCTTNEDIESMKMKFEKKFSNAYFVKNSKDNFTQGKTIWRVIRTGRNKFISLFCPVNSQ